MQLDVVVPTYNRRSLLERTLASLERAAVPENLSVRVLVIDNNSTDDTRAYVAARQTDFAHELHYVFETKPGRSHALNAGIAAASGELVGMIDDDEEIDATWFTCIGEAFSEASVDFIGGRYLPRWGAEPPAWLPKEYPGVIGWIDPGDAAQVYDENFPGILMGGNAVIRRRVLNQVGSYLTSVSRNNKRLLAGEDEDMYRRLLAAGARGFYRPDLIIHHYIPPERLTKSYHRRWCFWRGVSSAIVDGEQKAPVAYLGGVPRYLYGRAARGVLRLTKDVVRRSRKPSERFSDELGVWDLVGFFYGKHFYKPAHQDTNYADKQKSAPPASGRVSGRAQPARYRRRY